jgi:alpha-D-ribose 1-methylphosphonate 5-triphosphate synthase subunit PhnH
VNPSRVTIFTALFNVVKTVANFQTVNQRFIPWTQLSAAQMPALTAFEDRDVYEWLADPLARIKMRVHLIMYFAAPQDLTFAPVQDLDNVLDALDVALRPSGTDQATGRQTLGGLVYNARIEGEVVKASGDLDGISALICPVEVTVAQKSV